MRLNLCKCRREFKAPKTAVLSIVVICKDTTNVKPNPIKAFSMQIGIQFPLIVAIGTFVLYNI